MTKEIFVKQLQEIIENFNQLKSKAKYDDLSDLSAYHVEDLTLILTKAKAAVARVVGTNSEYYKDVITALNSRNHEGTRLRLIIGTVKALKSDLESDYLKSLHDLIQADVFSNYLEMAEYLLSEGFKDASAVIAGSTLEIQLRDLCKSNAIAIDVQNSKGKFIPKKADVMNADLYKAGIYSSGYQKQVTAWLDIRNSAAHGHYDSYTAQEIKLMLQGVKQFILSTS